MISKPSWRNPSAQRQLSLRAGPTEHLIMMMMIADVATLGAPGPRIEDVVAGAEKVIGTD